MTWPSGEMTTFERLARLDTAIEAATRDPDSCLINVGRLYTLVMVLSQEYRRDLYDRLQEERWSER